MVTVASDDDFSRNGYIFIGWNTKEDGSGSSFSPNSKIELDESTTLYAQWEAKDGIPYTIEYYLQNRTGGYPVTASETDHKNGKTGALVNAGNRMFDGYTYDAENAKNVQDGVITGDGKYSLQGTTQSRYLTGGVPPVRFSI